MSEGSVLGISPGGRFLGLAVLDGNGTTLLHAQVHAFFGTWSDAKLHSMLHLIESLIKRHKITEVTIKVPDVLPLNKSFHQLIGAINVLCERIGLKPRYYSLSEIKKYHCTGKRPHMEQLMQKMVEKHPELICEYKREQENSNAYYYKLFEAVAAARME